MCKVMRNHFTINLKKEKVTNKFHCILLYKTFSMTNGRILGGEERPNPGGLLVLPCTVEVVRYKLQIYSIRN
jgi:hypothetical protein